MSIASQLQAIKSVIKGKEDLIRRPITRPSVLFDPKDAADIDLRSILPLAQSGLDALIEVDDRFLGYKSTLFSHATLEIDRDKMTPKEEAKLNNSICSYLQLLSGQLHLPSAFRTMEYLIRRYQVHIFNVEELVLCALPYHDTHGFVRIIQLMNFGNKKWAFLEGVKTSGATLPRKLIVQQCIRDKGVLEALCNYASPSKYFLHSRPVICFCTAVIVEMLGSLQKLDTDTIQKILSFVFNGLNPAVGGSSDHVAGALMVVGLLASRAALASKLVQNLVFFLARLAQHDAKNLSDMPRLRLAIMTIVTLVQSQSSQVFPKKTMMMLKEIRDFIGILSGLSQEFNTRKFVHLYIESLIEYSLSDDCCCRLLLNTLEVLPVNDFVENIVHKILGKCIKFLNTDYADSSAAGIRVKQILVKLNKQYQSELRGAVHKFIENPKWKFGEENSAFLVLCQLLDENSDMPMKLSDANIWFSLEHPKAGVRRITLLDLASSGKLESFADNPSKLINYEDAIIRRLLDEDLTVVHAALSVKELSKIVSPPLLLKTYHDVFLRCMNVLKKDTEMLSQACDIMVLCLNHMVVDNALHQNEFVMEVAEIIFPILLILPQTCRVNVKALKVVKNLQWSFYSAFKTCDLDFVEHQVKKLDHEQMTTNNIRTIQLLAAIFAGNPLDHFEWLVKCSSQSNLAKCFFFFIILQSLVICKEETGKLWRLLGACFVAVKNWWYEMIVAKNVVFATKFLSDEWCEVQSQGDAFITGELNLEIFDKSYRRLVKQLLHHNVDMLSEKILICINWCLLEICSGVSRRNKFVEDQQLVLFDELFLFFASSSLSIFKKQLPFVVINCCKSPFQFLTKYFVEEGFSAAVQVDTLFSFASICFVYASDWILTNENTLQSLLVFPSLLVPLTNDDKEIRTAALNCIEGIYKMWQCFDVSCLKNGNDAMFLQCVTSSKFGDFLESFLNQKLLISSDVNFLPSFVTSLLSSSSDSLLVPDNCYKRLDQSSKDAILLFILTSALKFPSYGKHKILCLLKAMGKTLLQMDGCKELLLELLKKREEYYTEAGVLHGRLSKYEIETLCLLLELCALQSCSFIDDVGVSCLVKVLKIDGLPLNESAVVKPCVTVLKNLRCSFYSNLNSNLQDEIFISLVFLFRCNNGDLRNAARDLVLNLNINCATVARFLEEILYNDRLVNSPRKSRKHQVITSKKSDTCKDMVAVGEKAIFALGSLLEILLLKKDLVNRVSLVEPLFVALDKFFSNDWLLGLLPNSSKNESGSGFSELFSALLYSAQHSILIILKDIVDSNIVGHPDNDNLCDKLNINLLVECAHSAKDVTTRNHIFLLLSSIAKISSGQLYEHIIELFVIVGKSALKQKDQHSQQVLENLISALVPFWLAKTNSAGKLFQIFLKGLPDIAEERWIPVLVYLVRTLGEKDSLGILFYQLFHSLSLRLDMTSHYSEAVLHDLLSTSSLIFKEFEYRIALQLCNQYSIKIWLPSLVQMLQEIELCSKQQKIFPELVLALQFILCKLKDTEFAFELESGRDSSYVQAPLGVLMEQVILHSHLLGNGCKQLGFSKQISKEARKCISQILKSLTTYMNPDTFFKCIVQLLGNDDCNVIEKTLDFLCESIKDYVRYPKDKEITKKKGRTAAFKLQITAPIMPSFIELCFKINQLISSHSLHIAVQLAAISSIETLALELPCDEPIFGTCLQCVVGKIESSDLALSSACIRCVAALVGVLGSHALKFLPCIMTQVLKKAHEVSKCSYITYRQSTNEVESFKAPVLLSTLSALEAVITNLGGFLNPYLDDILDVIILHSDFISDLDLKIKTKAITVRKLLTEKIPVRLLLPPSLRVTETALRCGETSLSLVFEMLENMIGGMDRSSIASFHVKIYEQCLASLNIRHQVPESIKDINMVEQSVIQTMVALTMRLTETMFKPLFFHSLEWAELELEDNQSTKSISIDRSISFYSLINKLVQKHRSLFVPYFKYLLGSCTQFLTQDGKVDYNFQTQKRKKAKTQDSCTNVNPLAAVSTKLWHLRALILKALYHCFLFDTADTKFLDAANFQVLLKPIISQLNIEPPASLNCPPDVPTVDTVDECLVLCLGQMAVAAKSDVLWKPLNHEVLMQTRNKKIRPKILSLRVIKYLVEHLREEYLVFLPETIPFLGELLEDVELSVKTLAQVILKEMEVLSGESLKQYL